MKSNFYVPANEFDPYIMVQNINSLRVKEREMEAHIKRLEKDLDELKAKIRISLI